MNATCIFCSFNNFRDARFHLANGQHNLERSTIGVNRKRQELKGNKTLARNAEEFEKFLQSSLPKTCKAHSRYAFARYTLQQSYVAFIKHIKTKRKSDGVAGIFEQTRNKPWYTRGKKTTLICLRYKIFCKNFPHYWDSVG